MPTNSKAGITRRGFMQVGSAATLAGGLLSSATGTENSLPSASLPRKIALEEQFDCPCNCKRQLWRSWQRTASAQ